MLTRLSGHLLGKIDVGNRVLCSNAGEPGLESSDRSTSPPSQRHYWAGIFRFVNEPV